MFPDNLLEAAFHHVRTVKTNFTKYRRCGNSTYNETVETGWILEQERGMNVLGLIVFSVALGITLAKMGEAGRPLKQLFFCLNEAVMRLITVVIWYDPSGWTDRQTDRQTNRQSSLLLTGFKRLTSRIVSKTHTLLYVSFI